MNTRPILYAEDEENDAFFMKRAFDRVGITQPLVVVKNGQEVIDYCSGTGGFSNRETFPLPALLLLDLNMPQKSGLDALKWIRTQPTTSTLPVIVVTSSIQDADIHRAYLQGANAYLVKPSRPDDLVTMVKAIKDFWLAHNRAAEVADGGSSEIQAAR